jgi:hypothetical protein
VTEPNGPSKYVLPSTPRAVTPRVTKRSWGEGPVRFWWTSALAVTLVGAYVAYVNAAQELKHRRLLETGLALQATAHRVNGYTASDNPRYAVQRDQSIAVELDVTLPDGSPLRLTGYLPQNDGYIRIGQAVQVRVDPNDHTNWAEERDLLPWWRVLALPVFLLLPVVLLLLGIAEWRRRMFLRVWREGMRAEGLVVDVRHPAAAPLSRVVRFSIVDARDRRVFKMLYPTRAGVPNKGDSLTLLMRLDRPQDAIVAELYCGHPVPPPTHSPFPVAEPKEKPGGFPVVQKQVVQKENDRVAAD